MRPSCSSVSPGPSNSTSVDSGLGKRVVAGGKFCGSYSSSFVGCPVDGPRLLADVFPVDGKDDDELRAGDEEESAEVPKSLPNPYQPTRSEYLDHCTTHFPFRAWCRHCLEGRGREFGHSGDNGWKDARAAAVVSFDYAFLSDSGDVTTEDEFTAAGEGAAKVLVIRDSRSKSLFAHIVPVKGVDDRGFAVQALVDDIKWLGYTDVTLKSDNEPAIVKLLAEALRELRINGVEKVLEEHSPEYDPKANGSAEVGVRLLKGQFRTLRSCLEEHIGHRIPVRHPLMSWLVRHSANLVTWCTKGHDGQTAYQRVRHREFTTRLLAFGEACSFKNRMLEPVSSTGGRRFHKGVFIGIDRRTGQYMVYSDGQVKLSRTVMRLPDDNKFDKDILAGIAVTPWSLHETRKPEVICRPKEAATEQQQFADKVYNARNVYLQASDFENFGLTRGCMKCDHKLKYGTWGSSPHSQACRRRIEAELAKTPSGMARLRTASTRLDRSQGEIGERMLQQAAPRGS